MNLPCEAAHTRRGSPFDTGSPARFLLLGCRAAGVASAAAGRSQYPPKESAGDTGAAWLSAASSPSSNERCSRTFPAPRAARSFSTALSLVGKLARPPPGVGQLQLKYNSIPTLRHLAANKYEISSLEVGGDITFRRFSSWQLFARKDDWRNCVPN